MTAGTLFDANIAVFERHFPALHARLTALTKPLSSLIYDGDEAVDIHLGDGRLYRGDGRKFAVEQANAFVKSPAQVGYLIPDPVQLDSMLSRHMHQDLLNAVARHGIDEMPLATDGETGFFFIYGVGLGYHLPILLEKIRAPHVVICEAFEEFLLASMQAVDWGALMEACERHGSTLHLICDRSAEGMARQATDVIEYCGPVLLDGSYVYQHYALWAYQEAKRRLINELPRQMVARGYFEDERKMVRNTATNLQKFDVHVLTGAYRRRTHIPVFVIGAGPSLDEAMPYIKEWREHAIVFSAGSGLQPCLRNGIIPDFHVEIENTYSIYVKLKFILDQNADMFPSGMFEGIRFISSVTVNPAVLPMFTDALLFFRDSATSSLSFGREFGVHTGVAPTVANTSIGVIARLGLGNVYLFGVDCGWRDNSSHHARETIYYTADIFREHALHGTYTLPGNFGGVVQSDLVFDWCRNVLEESFDAFQLDVYNCSDGALLKGATPRLAEALHFDGEPLDRQAVIAEIVAGRPHFRPGEFFATRSIIWYQEQLDIYEAAVTRLVDTAIGEKWTFRQFHDAFWRELGGEASDRGMGMAAWVQYASIGMLKHSCVFLNRIPDREKRAAVTLDFFGLFKQAHAEMFAETRAHLEEIDAWVQGGPEPEWTDGVWRVTGTSY